MGFLSLFMLSEAKRLFFADRLLSKDTFRKNDLYRNSYATTQEVEMARVRSLFNEKTEHMIERQTTKVPSDVYLWAALGAVGASAALQFMHREERSLFIGQWVPTLLLLGLYTRMLKFFKMDKRYR